MFILFCIYIGVQEIILKWKAFFKLKLFKISFKLFYDI